VDIRTIDDLAVLRVLCGSAPTARILEQLRSAVRTVTVKKMVVILDNLQRVDTSISAFLSAVDDILSLVPHPLLIFESSGFFETMAGASRPYLFSKSESEALDQVSTEFKPEERPVDESGKTRVLIIEDDPDVMEFLVDLLDTEDRFEVRCATSGFEGGLATAYFQPHLILLDIMLPDIDGRDVCRILRSNQKVGDPKIIAITALSREKDVSEIISVGVDDYLGKPFRINVLMKKIDSLLDEAE